MDFERERQQRVLSLKYEAQIEALTAKRDKWAAACYQSDNRLAKVEAERDASVKEATWLNEELERRSIERDALKAERDSLWLAYYTLQEAIDPFRADENKQGNELQGYVNAVKAMGTEIGALKAALTGVVDFEANWAGPANTEGGGWSLSPVLYERFCGLLANARRLLGQWEG